MGVADPVSNLDLYFNPILQKETIYEMVSWDGQENREFWRMDGCGPSAIGALPSGDFLVTGYDSGSIARISPSGETITE